MAFSDTLGGSKNAVKFAIIGVCFAGACVLLAYNFGLISFDAKPKAATATPDDTKVREDFKKKIDAEAKKPNPPVLGPS